MNIAETQIAAAPPYRLTQWTQLAEKITHAWRRQVPTGALAAAMLAHEDTRELIRVENARRKS